MRCDIITPERVIFTGDCVSVVAPARDGLVGILPKHAPMVTELGAGVVTVETPHDKVDTFEKVKFAVHSGFLQVTDDRVTVLAVKAAMPQDVKDADLEADKSRNAESAQEPMTAERSETLAMDRDWVEARSAIQREKPFEMKLDA